MSEQAQSDVADGAETKCSLREAVARCLVLHDPNYEVFHMPGETPRKWEAENGVRNTREMREAEAEQVRKRADALITEFLNFYPPLPRGWTRRDSVKASWLLNTLAITPPDEWRSKLEIHAEMQEFRDIQQVTK